MSILPHQRSVGIDTPEVTEEIRSDLRARLTHVIASGKQNKTLHIPNDDGEPTHACTPIYGGPEASITDEKPIEMIPPGYYKWCRLCVKAVLDGEIELPPKQ